MPGGPDEPFLADGFDDRPARITLADVRADVPAALRLALGVVAAGLPLGVLWAFLAPGVGTVVLAGGASGALPGENDHAFDAVAVFVLLVAAFGVIAGVVAWRRRAVRGPVALASVVLASLVAAWLAGRVGGALAAGPVLPSPVPVLIDRAATSGGGPGPAPPTLPGTLTTTPASPGPWWAAVAAGLTAALSYVAGAIADGHEDPRRPDAA